MKIISRSKAYCDPNWGWDSQTTHRNGYNLWYISKGKGGLKVDSTTYTLEPGACFLLNLKERHIAWHEPDNPLVVPFVIFDDITNESTLPARFRIINDSFFFEKLMDKIIFSDDENHAKTWLNAALAMLIEHDILNAKTIKMERENLSRIYGIAERIRSNPEACYDVTELAEQACYSTDHFIRVFKQQLGLTPGQFVIQQKINKAGELLKISNFHIQTIADMLGYQDIYTFSKQFRNKTGVSPTQFRRQM